MHVLIVEFIATANSSQGGQINMRGRGANCVHAYTHFVCCNSFSVIIPVQFFLQKMKHVYEMKNV